MNGFELGNARLFWHPRRIVGCRAFGWQLDWRFDSWLPFSIRTGRRHWQVLNLGRLGVLTAGRVERPLARPNTDPKDQP